MNIKDLNNNETIIFSIVLGVIIALALGYITGETQYITAKGYRLKEATEHTFEVYKINYLIFFCGFIISSGVSYLYLKKRKDK